MNFTPHFNPYFYKAKIIDVYDGDTVTAIIDLGFNVTVTEKLRLHGINAPEVRGKERPMGLKSRDFLRSMVLNKEILIQTIKDKKGKYGRYLATLWIFDKEDETALNINDVLVVYGHAKTQNY